MRKAIITIPHKESSDTKKKKKTYRSALSKNTYDSKNRKNHTQVEHEFNNMDDDTVLKYYNIYNDYIKLYKKIERQFPELANYVNRRYYYSILSNKHHLSVNYICSMICKIQNYKDIFDKSVVRVKLNQDSYEY